MNTIRRLMLGGLAAMVGGTALAQPPAARQPAAATVPMGKPPVAKVDPRTGAYLVPAGSIVSFKPRLPAGKQIIKVQNLNVNIFSEAIDPTDNNAYIITGLQTGIGVLQVTVGDGKGENVALDFEIVVQPDFELLKRTLIKAVPTASIEIIAGPGNTIILTGYVNKPEDAQTVLEIARSTTITSATTTQTTGTSTGPTGPASTQPGAVQPTGGTSTTQNSAVSTQTQTVGQIINAIQVGGLQHVQIEVVFASVNRSKLRERGTDFTINGTQGNFSSVISGLLGAGGGVASQQANLQFGIAPAGLFVALRAFKSENLAKFLSEPKIVTQSGRPAILRSGGRQAVIGPNNGALGGTSVVLEPVGTTMSVLPIVYGNGKIYMEVSPSIITPNAGFGINLGGGVTSTGFSEQSVTSSVMLESGQTFAIGGLLETQVQTTAARVPVIGELPYVGPLFSRSSTSEIETELVILVTPRLVDALDCNQTPKRVPGRETRSPDDYEFYLEGLLEAPRGQRQVWNGKCYNAAWKCDPTKAFPCKNNVCGDGGNCGGAVPTCLPGTTTVKPIAPLMAVPAAMPAMPTAAPVTAPETLPTAIPTIEPIVMPQVAPITPEVIVPVLPDVNVTPGPVAPSDVPAPAPTAPGGN